MFVAPAARRSSSSLAGLAVLVVCAVSSRRLTVGSLERRVFEAINGLPDVLSPPMRLAQFLGVLVGRAARRDRGALILRRWRLALAAVLVTLGKLGSRAYGLALRAAASGPA